MAENGWQRKFEDPIPLPDGRTLVTLRDATDYITSLPKEEIRPRRLAGCDRGIDVGFAKWSHDDGADRGREGAEPSYRSGIQSGSESYALGETEAQERGATFRREIYLHSFVTR